MSGDAQANGSAAAAAGTGASSSGVTFRKQSGMGEGEAKINFVRPSKLTGPGTLAEGIYVGSVANNFEPNKLDYKIEGTDGRLTIINTAGNLDYQMKNIEVGQLIQINYLGKQAIKKGDRKGKLAHTFEVLVADNM